MKDITISDSIFYVGADDTMLDLFESQYIVPEGVSYNSYVIMDDKITIMDTVDQRATEEWIANVKNVLKDKTPAYLVVSHMEPDHAANIQKIAEMYPEMKIIGNAKTFSMMPQFFDFDLSNRSVVVKEGEEICVLVNGLGATSIEELYILSGSVRKILDEKGIKTYRTFVGEYATSMEMAGASISICKVDDEMKKWIDMPVKTPFYTQA